MSTFVTGSTGLVGKRIVRALLARGETVLPLSRKPLAPDAFGTGDCRPVQGDPTQPGVWLNSIAECDAVIHLAGEPILAKRWNAAFLERIRSSRVDSTRLIAEAMAHRPTRADGKPKVLVSASGIGYFGQRVDGPTVESDPPGVDPMAEVCVAWEAAADAARTAGVRVVHPRFGIILDRDEGALPRLALPFKLFVGGRIGDGKQGMNWVHIDDIVGLILHFIDSQGVRGPVNAVAPGCVSNAEFSRTLAKVLRRPCLFPVPVIALRLLLGKVASVIAGGQWAKPQAAEASGYTFRFPDLEPALRDLFSKAG